MARGQGSVGAWEGRRKGGRVGRREGGERKSRSMEQFVIPNQPQEMPQLGEAMEGGSEGGREWKKVKERKKGASENYIWTKRLHPCLPIPTIYSFSNREGLHVPHPTIPPYASAGWKLNLQDHKKFSGTCTEITRAGSLRKKIVLPGHHIIVACTSPVIQIFLAFLASTRCCASSAVSHTLMSQNLSRFLKWVREV